MQNDPIGEKIASLHAVIHAQAGNVGRIGIALYDRSSDQLSTFMHTVGNTAPERYRAQLSDLPELHDLLLKQRCETIDDLTALAAPPNDRIQHSLAAGFRSSYTCPLYSHGQPLGFLFFESTQPGYFHRDVKMQLDGYAQLITTLISCDLSNTRALRSAVALTRELARHRDEETAGHVNRVAHYTRSIAAALGDEAGLSEDDIEFLFQFAALHDIGKIAIPDRILLKPAKLTPEEYAIAQSHVQKGSEMIDAMMREFDLASERHAQMLRDVISCHHERWDGGGYPHGLAGEAIPLAGRIVAVADVFDALTNHRPYKRAWTLDAGFDYLRSNAGSQFDPRCVAAIDRCSSAWRDIYAKFNESDAAANFAA